MNVILYSTTNCPACKVAKNFLETNNIDFQYINVEEDEVALEQMIEKTHMMKVPVLDIDGQILVGFNKENIIKAINR